MLLQLVQRIETLNLMQMDAEQISLIPSSVCSRVRSLECCLCEGYTNFTRLSEFGALEELTFFVMDGTTLCDTLRELTEPQHTVRKLVIHEFSDGACDAYTVRRIIHCFPRVHTLTLKYCEMSAEARVMWHKSALKDVELIFVNK